MKSFQVGLDPGNHHSGLSCQFLGPEEPLPGMVLTHNSQAALSEIDAVAASPTGQIQGQP